MSLRILENEPLAQFTTFRIGGPARYFAEVKSLTDLQEALSFAKIQNLPIYLLSGGSNVLISDDGFPGLVIRIGLKGFEVVTENPTESFVKVAAGENWDEIVAWACASELWGIENLSHIPGKVGGFPVQNVGAYGQEASQVVVSIDVYDKTTDTVKTLTKDQCEFSYRQSIFNTSQKGRYIILFVRLRLSKIPHPNLAYKDLAEFFKDKPSPSLIQIRQAIIEIRNKKYPFPVSPTTGNSGSWFKNLFLNFSEYQALTSRIKTLYGETAYERVIKFGNFSENSNYIKIPAAFLLDICNLKDLTFGGAALCKNQPLVIINKTGDATARDCLNLAKSVQSEVFSKLSVNLVIEPELVGFSLDDLKSVSK